MDEHIVAKAQLTERTAYLNAMQASGVKYMESTTCTEITDKGARVKNADGEQFLDADTVIIAVGTTLVTWLSLALGVSLEELCCLEENLKLEDQKYEDLS